MRYLLILLITIISPKLCEASELPKEIQNAFIGDNKIRESDFFIDYIKTNWRWITEDLKIIPPSNGDFTSAQDAFDASVIILGQTCENLSPLDYVSFLERFVILYEQKSVSKAVFQQVLLNENLKIDFLSVNYEHPRVEGILKKTMALTPATDGEFLGFLEAMPKGELADNYMYDKPDDAPLPETLPGIKLRRPWDSLIKKYERITGKRSNEGAERTSSRRLERPSTRQNSPVLTNLPTLSSDLSQIFFIVGIIISGGFLCYGVIRWRRRIS